MSETMKTSPKSGLALRLLRYSLPYWRSMLLSLVLILIISAMINYLPVLIKRMTDSCLLNEEIGAEERLKGRYFTESLMKGRRASLYARSRSLPF